VLIQCFIYVLLSFVYGCNSQITRLGVLTSPRIAENPYNAYSRFGYSVSTSGSTLVVGEPFYPQSSPLYSSGGVNVYVKSGSSWSLQASLLPSTREDGAQFGYSISISGDTFVAGAIREDVNGYMDAGAAYVFVRSGSSWTQQARLKASNPGELDRFGESVSISGNYIVVGAMYEDSNAKGVGGSQTDNSARESGAAYVFVRSGTTWTQQAYLKPSNTREFFRFGASVSISGDVIVVGAPGEDSNGQKAERGSEHYRWC
jgi:hypothetical protein